MNEKPIEVCHRVCVGCETGKLRAELADRLNAAKATSYKRLSAENAHHNAELEAYSERIIVERGGDSFIGSDALREMASHAAGLVDGIVQNSGLTAQEVVCSQDGPSGFFRRCGAVAVNRR